MDAATTAAALAAQSRQCPDTPFVVAEDGSVDYAEAARICADVADGLAEAGLRPGDRIGVLLPNGVRWCLAALGAHAAGLGVVPLNTWYRERELADVVDRAGLRAIMSAPADGDDPAPEPTLLTLSWRRGARLPDGVRPSDRDTAQVAARLESSPVDGDSEAFLLFTSGSTARPKAVPLPQAGLVRNAYAVGERQGVVTGDGIWFAAPLFFVFGCCNALPNALTHGATLCVQERFDAASALEFIERNACTVYYGVAPMTRALAAHPDLATRDISTLRTGTANATPEDLRIAIEVLGVGQVCNAYGMTEAYGHTTITDHTDPPEIRMHTQGRALPTQQIRVVDDAGEPVAPGRPGHIQLRGCTTPGYLDGDQPESGLTADGWFRTGDLGTLDDNERLHFLGRSTDVIKSKGINVSPAEVEALLGSHPAVDEAYVFGVPTGTGDEQVGAALVCATAPAEPADLAASVRLWAADQLARYKLPTLLWVIEPAELPLTATGKVSKRLLRDKVVDRHPDAGG